MRRIFIFIPHGSEMIWFHFQRKFKSYCILYTIQVLVSTEYWSYIMVWIADKPRKFPKIHFRTKALIFEISRQKTFLINKRYLRGVGTLWILNCEWLDTVLYLYRMFTCSYLNIIQHIRWHTTITTRKSSNICNYQQK